MDDTLDQDRPRHGRTLAVAFAGPTFVAMAALGQIVAASWQPIAFAVVPEVLGSFALLSVPVAMVGAILAVAPVVLGSALMRGLGRINIAMRLPMMWSIVGGALASAIPVALEAGGAIVFAFGATGAVCAALARRSARW